MIRAGLAGMRLPVASLLRLAALIAVLPIVAVVSDDSAVFAQEGDLAFLQTRAERSGYQETTGYDEAIGFLEVAVAQSSALSLTTFGYSGEGRPLPLVVWGAGGADPESVRADGRLRIFIQANIHAGEVCGKEAMLAMVRDLADGQYDAWLDSVVLLIAPIYNADGNERVTLFNRPRQNGPIGGMGQRPNADGLDLNRDHMKLASPEARSLVRLISAYDPEILVDLHTTNGTRHGYHLTYAPPLNPNTAPSIDSLLREELLPDVTDAIREKHGWEFYHYGNLPWRGGEPGWFTFDHRPRFSNNYGGLRHRLAILSEAYAYASFENRIATTRAFVEEIIAWGAGNVPAVRAAIDEAEAYHQPGDPLAVASVHSRSEEPVSILMGTASTTRNPFSGRQLVVREDSVWVQEMYEYIGFEPSEVATLPAHYLVPASETRILNMLEDHGIASAVISELLPGAPRAFVVDSLTASARPFQQVNEQRVHGAWQPVEDFNADDGWVAVSVSQPLGLLAAYLLDPRSDDGLLNWAIIGDLGEGDRYPVLALDPLESGDD